MTSKEAYRLILEKFEGKKAVRCMEYDSIFTFIVVPESYDESKPVNGMLIRPWAVNKKTGEVYAFNPLKDIPREEFMQGKQVLDFK